MRNKLIFITGVGVGYVLGTRAGREKFDQMLARARQVWESPTMQEAAGVMQEQALRLYDDGRHVVTDQVHRLSRRNGGGDEALTGARQSDANATGAKATAGAKEDNGAKEATGTKEATGAKEKDNDATEKTWEAASSTGHVHGNSF